MLISLLQKLDKDMLPQYKETNDIHQIRTRIYGLDYEYPSAG